MPDYYTVKYKDVQKEIKTYISEQVLGTVDSGIAINLDEFGAETPVKAILIKRDGSFSYPDYDPIEDARIQIVCREHSKKKAWELWNRIRTIIDHKGGYNAGTARIYYSELNGGPNTSRSINQGYPQVYGYYRFQIRKDK